MVQIPVTELLLGNSNWLNVLKNGPSKICGGQPSKNLK